MASVIPSGFTSSSNSKYANLPGIAHGQPDVYETPDIPEPEDQDLDYSQYDDNKNPCIETPSISVEAAFERFRLQRLHGNVNFFDLYKGYSNDPIQEPRKETVAEKLARLKLEVAELAEEMVANPPSDPNQIDELQELEKKMAFLIKSKHPNPSLFQEKLTGYVQKPEPDADSLQYELHLEKRLNMTSSGAMSQKATELESRVQRLEQVLGQSKEHLAPLSFQPRHSSVLGALTVLHSKLELLEPAHIEIIESRLASVLQKVNSIVEKKLDVQELERNLKLSSLYDLLETSATTIEALPELSERFEALKDLHSHAAGVISEIGAIKAIQDGIAAGTLENEKLLRELKGTLSVVISEK